MARVRYSTPPTMFRAAFRQAGEQNSLQPVYVQCQSTHSLHLEIGLPEVQAWGFHLQSQHVCSRPMLCRSQR